MLNHGRALRFHDDDYLDDNNQIDTLRSNNVDLHDIQVKLEERMYADSLSSQFKSLVELSKPVSWSNGVHQLSDSIPGRTYVKSSAHSMIERVVEFMDTKKGAGRGKAWSKHLRDTGLRPDVVCWLTAKCIINSLNIVTGTNPHPKVSSVAIAIGRLIHDEGRVHFFAQQGKGEAKLLKAVVKRADQQQSKTNKRKHIHRVFEEKNIEWTVWSDEEVAKVGCILLEIFIAETGLVMKGGARDAYLITTEEFEEHWNNLLPKQILAYMRYRPMVVPPQPWTRETLFRGGYVTEKTRRYPIIKGSTKKDIPRFLKMDWSNILPAVNAIQETPWRINKTMLEAVKWVFKDYAVNNADKFPHVKGIGKLVSSVKMEFRGKPSNLDDPEVYKENLKHCAEVHRINRTNKSRRRAVVGVIGVAEEYQHYDAIYFPHDLDSRGRAYPVTTWLSPQAADFAKSLLEFANGHQINNADDAEWLMIHGANTYGNDKVSLKDRVQWTLDNEEMILSVATDYTSDHRWLHVSEPFAFLRFCLEWKGYRDHGKGYVSHIVIPVDATCSGLQHYAAMLQDEVGGRSVNLVPGLSRQDIYADVARVALDKLHADGSDNALRWIAFGVDRKMTKRQVMVVPYAGKFSSCLEYTREGVQEKLNDGKELWFDLRDRELEEDPVVLLAQCIWEAISDVVVKGKEGMQWLGQVASAWTRYVNDDQKFPEGDAYSRKMSWTTPDGFEVIQYRPEQERKQVETVFGGRLRISMYEDTGKLESRAMNSSLAPNFVHALDATLLRMTTIRGLNSGITSFAMIHDSFGVHAPLMGRFLKECIKPAMYHLYADRDVLQEFADTFPMLEVPPQPERGTLDLSGILQSEFVFS